MSVIKRSQRKTRNFSPLFFFAIASSKLLKHKYLQRDSMNVMLFFCQGSRQVIISHFKLALIPRNPTVKRRTKQNTS